MSTTFLVRVVRLGLTLSVAALSVTAGELPGTRPLEVQVDLPVEVVGSISHYLDRETTRLAEERAALWQHTCTHAADYADFVARKRPQLARLLGVVDERATPVVLRQQATTEREALLGEGDDYRTLEVRWPVLEGLEAEGLYLEPKGKAAGCVIALPDADVTPEQLVGLTGGLPPEAQMARRLAEAGFQVVVPVLIDRRDTFSGHPEVRYTNQPHREWIYRAAYQMGRHVIGYEIQKVLAAVDYFERGSEGAMPAIGLAGDGEGGRVALYAAALDPRIDAVWVGGCFGPREAMWREPIYRNIWSFLRDYGDAELAAMVAPRGLVIEASRHPEVAGPPPERDGRRGAAPGILSTPALAEVRREFERASEIVGLASCRKQMTLVETPDGRGSPGSPQAFERFLELMNVSTPTDRSPDRLDHPVVTRTLPDADARMRRQVAQMMAHVQRLVDRSERVRERFWSEADRTSPETWRASTEKYRRYLHEEVIGRLPPPSVPPDARARPVREEPAWTAYQVVMNVQPDLIAGGLLLVPAGIAPGERRPAVICQHGLEGRPEVTIAGPGEPKYAAYRRYAAKLAEQGVVVFAPQNPYIGGDAFRVLQRKANPLKLSLYSFILCQEEQMLDWLGALPFVDASRIGYYGLSYGGKTALRCGAVLRDRYAAVICSGDYNTWTRKLTSVTAPFSYMFTHEYEIFEFDMGHTFDHAEMACLMAPVPFMVERGHDDGVSWDEWVAYAYAPVRRHYVKLGVGDRTAIAWFDGTHRIDGEATFAFLQEYLDGNDRRRGEETPDAEAP